MGINDLNPTIKDIEKDVIALLLSQGIRSEAIAYLKGITMNRFSGKKIAFDISIVVYAKIHAAHNELLSQGYTILNPYDRTLLQNLFIKKTLGFFVAIMKEGITPIVVFDGKTHPYKLEEIRRRAADSKKIRENAESIAELYLNVHPLDRTQEMEDEIKKVSKNYVKILREDYHLLEEVLSAIGISCLKAEYEGEKLCAALSREGIVDAVYSTDTDCLPLGTLQLITKIEYDHSIGMLKCEMTSLQGIFFLLQCYFNYESSMNQFVDFCIMCGCDFNQRMVVPKKTYNAANPYKSCGPKTSLDLIKQYIKFENFPANLYPLMWILNISKCREMFSYVPSGFSDETTNFDWELFKRNHIPITNKYNLERYNQIQLSQIDKNIIKIKRNHTNYTQESLVPLSLPTVDIFIDEIGGEEKKNIEITTIDNGQVLSTDIDNSLLKNISLGGYVL